MRCAWLKSMRVAIWRPKPCASVGTASEKRRSKKRSERKAEQRGGEPLHLPSGFLQFPARLCRHRLAMEEVTTHAIEAAVDLARKVGRDGFLLVDSHSAILSLQLRT